MKLNASILVIASLLLIFNGELVAQKGQHKGKQNNKSKTHNKGNHAKKPGKYSRSKAVVIKRRRINKLNALPKGHIAYSYRGKKYYSHNGYYYHYVGGTYNMIASPRGLRVKILPIGYRKIVIRKRPYFYYSGTFYIQVEDEYEIVEAPEEASIDELPEYNVEEITIDGETYFEIDNVLYQQVNTDGASKYLIVGKLED